MCCESGHFPVALGTNTSIDCAPGPGDTPRPAILNYLSFVTATLFYLPIDATALESIPTECPAA